MQVEPAQLEKPVATESCPALELKQPSGALPPFPGTVPAAVTHVDPNWTSRDRASWPKQTYLPVCEPWMFVRDGKSVYSSRVDLPGWGESLIADLMQISAGFARIIYSTAFIDTVDIRPLCTTRPMISKEGRVLPSVLEYVEDSANPDAIRKVILSSWGAATKPVLYDGEDLLHGAALVHIISSLWRCEYNVAARAYVRVSIVSSPPGVGTRICTVLCAAVPGKMFNGKIVPSTEAYLAQSDGRKSPIDFIRKTFEYDYVPEIKIHQEKMRESAPRTSSA